MLGQSIITPKSAAVLLGQINRHVILGIDLQTMYTVSITLGVYHTNPPIYHVLSAQSFQIPRLKQGWRLSKSASPPYYVENGDSQG
jgi:hypothetical protein